MKTELYERKNHVIDYLISALFTFYIFTLAVFAERSETLIISKIAFLAAVVVALLVMFLRNMPIKLGVYMGIYLSFVAFCLCSVLWAMNSDFALVRTSTLAQIAVMLVVFISYFYGTKNEEFIVYGIVYTGIALSVYCFIFYGIDEIFNFNTRLSTEFSNSNSIGMNQATSSIFSLYLFQKTKRPLYLLYIVPMSIIVFSTGSRKGLVLLVLGIVMMIMYNALRSGMLVKNLLKVLFILFVAVLVISFLVGRYSSSIAVQRLTSMLNFWSEEGNADNSTLTRMQMIEIGWNTFLENPVTGVGIDNSRVVLGNEISWQTYSHNNFVELLSGVGVIGFSIYYSLYVYIFVKLWKKVRNKERLPGLIAGIMLLRLVMDYGAVSYYSQMNYVYLILALTVAMRPSLQQQGDNSGQQKERGAALYAEKNLERR